MSKGFIRLPRAFFDTLAWQSKRKFTPTEAWIDLVRRARYDTEPVTEIINRHRVVYGYGELCGSIRYLSTAWQWTPKAVRCFIRQLKAEGFISVRYVGRGISNIIRILYDPDRNAALRTAAADLQPSSPDRRETGRNAVPTGPVPEKAGTAKVSAKGNGTEKTAEPMKSNTLSTSTEPIENEEDKKKVKVLLQVKEKAAAVTASSPKARPATAVPTPQTASKEDGKTDGKTGKESRQPQAAKTVKARAKGGKNAAAKAKASAATAPKTLSKGEGKGITSAPTAAPTSPSASVRPATCATAETPKAAATFVLWPENPQTGLPKGFTDGQPFRTLCVTADGTSGVWQTVPPRGTPRGTPKGTPAEPVENALETLNTNTSEVLPVTSENPAKGTPKGTPRGTKNKKENKGKKDWKTPYTQTRTREEPPLAEEVKAYCLEAGLTAVDPERFYDYYTSRGWCIGSVPMADWRAALRYWNRCDLASRTSRSASPSRRTLYDLSRSSWQAQAKERANAEALAGYAARQAGRLTDAACWDEDF